jgi:hypothetical protein
MIYDPKSGTFTNPRTWPAVVVRLDDSLGDGRIMAMSG